MKPGELLFLAGEGDGLMDDEITGVVHIAPGHGRRYRMGHECGDLFEEGDDFDGYTLTVECFNAEEGGLMLDVLRRPSGAAEAARVLDRAISQDGDVMRVMVNAMVPTLRADISADSWNTVSEIRDALLAGFAALAEGDPPTEPGLDE